MVKIHLVWPLRDCLGFELILKISRVFECKVVSKFQRKWRRSICFDYIEICIGSSLMNKFTIKTLFYRIRIQQCVKNRHSIFAFYSYQSFLLTRIFTLANVCGGYFAFTFAHSIGRLVIDYWFCVTIRNYRITLVCDVQSFEGNY